MIQAPERLFQKASSLGFNCSTNWQEHQITPVDPADNWQLVYQAGYWRLWVNGTAQINLSYGEVTDFLERRSQKASKHQAASKHQTLTSGKI